MHHLDAGAAADPARSMPIPSQPLAHSSTAKPAVPPQLTAPIESGDRLSMLRPGRAARSRAKRVFDIAAAGVGLVALSPVLFSVGVAVRRTSPGPAIYRQERVGLCGQSFTIWKFRTMQDGADDQLNDLLASRTSRVQPLFKVSDDPRITALGGWLRRTSLDELPQLVNVIRGDMSLVGPRPQRTAEVVLYEDWHYERLTVRPGLTGAWQVNGRSDLDWAKAVVLDLDYIRSWSMWSDLRILARTVRVVVSGDGAY